MSSDVLREIEAQQASEPPDTAQGLLRRNLRLSVEQRLRNHDAALAGVLALRGKAPRHCDRDDVETLEAIRRLRIHEPDQPS